MDSRTLPADHQLSGVPLIGGARPVIQMKPGEKQFWRVANATLQDFMPLQFIVDGKPQPLQVIALDGYPLAQTRIQDTILVPPAGRAEFIVQAPAAGGSAVFLYRRILTPAQPEILTSSSRWPAIQVTDSGKASRMPKASAPASAGQARSLPIWLARQPTAERKLFFSEEFGGTNGPIQFFITVDGQKQKSF